MSALLALAGCERHMRDMYDQPRLDRGASSPLFSDQLASRPPPEGSVPQSSGELAATSGGRRGGAAVAQRERALGQRLAAVSRETLQRGRERYTIYCMPCHSPAGDGDGPIVRRGFPAPPTYHQPRLREASDRHIFDVITQGYGVMPSYADRIDAEDRWAIVAYVRALQWSQHAALADLPPSLQAALPAASGGSR
jgi:mono/diheme cytochrome c family protein